MIRAEEVKRAFRTAYNVLDTLKDPEGTPEYFVEALRRFRKAWDEDHDNELLKYLSIGICEWLGDVAKEKYLYKENNG